AERHLLVSVRLLIACAPRQGSTAIPAQLLVRDQRIGVDTQGGQAPTVADVGGEQAPCERGVDGPDEGRGVTTLQGGGSRLQVVRQETDVGQVGVPSMDPDLRQALGVTGTLFLL